MKARRRVSCDEGGAAGALGRVFEDDGACVDDASNQTAGEHRDDELHGHSLGVALL